MKPLTDTQVSDAERASNLLGDTKLPSRVQRMERRDGLLMMQGMLDPTPGILGLANYPVDFPAIPARLAGVDGFAVEAAGFDVLAEDDAFARDGSALAPLSANDKEYFAHFLVARVSGAHRHVVVFGAEADTGQAKVLSQEQLASALSLKYGSSWSGVAVCWSMGLFSRVADSIDVEDDMIFLGDQGIPAMALETLDSLIERE